MLIDSSVEIWIILVLAGQEATPEVTVDLSPASSSQSNSLRSMEESRILNSIQGPSWSDMELNNRNINNDDDIEDEVEGEVEVEGEHPPVQTQAKKSKHGK